MGDEKYLEPWEQALFFLYLTQKGIPPDVTNEAMLRKLMNWSEEETRDALEEARRRGMVDKS